MAGLGAIVVARRLPRGDRSGRAFWWSSGFLVLGLGANKEIDVHTRLLSQGRDVFASFGWLEYRDVTLLVLACLTLAAATTAAVPLIATGTVGRFWVGTGGIALLLASIVGSTLDLSHLTSGVVLGPWTQAALEFGGVVAVLAEVHRQRSSPRWWWMRASPRDRQV